MWGRKKIFLKDAWKATMYFCCFLCCFVLLAPQINIEKKGMKLSRHFLKCCHL
ncbi:unnamed protein product [Meloidogyne enterolobii]|uniref:Uncharacterized protein n=1 Tax=Meloidogyne enterolobii TaxID=390850 RepID=A0ACB0XWS4_MELEN